MANTNILLARQVYTARLFLAIKQQKHNVQSFGISGNKCFGIIKTNAMKLNIHKSINFRSWRKGLANDFLTTFKNKYPTVLPQMDYPSPTYGFYYPKVIGKKHSQYPMF